jgi:hypothetical protein
MLKFFVMINCDICGRTFENLAVSGITDPFIIDAITSDLERAAEESGWFYYREEHRCTNCLLNACYKQHQRQQEA